MSLCSYFQSPILDAEEDNKLHHFATQEMIKDIMKMSSKRGFKNMDVKPPAPSRIRVTKTAKNKAAAATVAAIAAVGSIRSESPTSTAQVVVLPPDVEQTASSRKPRKGTPVKLFTAPSTNETPLPLVVEPYTPVVQTPTPPPPSSLASADDNEKQLIFKRVCSTDAQQTLAKTQTLLLNGKRYEIVPVGDGRWITRNEYEMMRELHTLQVNAGMSSPKLNTPIIKTERAEDSDHSDSNELTIVTDLPERESKKRGLDPEETENNCKRARQDRISDIIDVNLNVQKVINHEEQLLTLDGEGKSFQVLKEMLNTTGSNTVTAK